MLKVISITVAIILLFNSPLTIYASDISNEYAEFVIPEGLDYSDDKVLVAFTNEVSLQFNTYSPEYFEEIKCKSISDLCVTSGTKIKQAIDNITQHINILMKEHHCCNIPEYLYHNIIRSSVSN